MSKVRVSQSRKGILIGIFTLLIGVLMLMGFITENQEVELIEEAANWPTTEGVITGSYVANNDYADIPVVKYEYVVDGHTYSSSGVGFGVNGTEGPDLEKYPEGRRVTVYYQPGHPQRAILEPERPANMQAYLGGILLSGFFVLLGLVILAASIEFPTSRLLQRNIDWHTSEGDY